MSERANKLKASNFFRIVHYLINLSVCQDEFNVYRFVTCNYQYLRRGE